MPPPEIPNYKRGAAPPSEDQEERYTFLASTPSAI